MGPLYKFGRFDFVYGLQLAGFIGFMFGFVLERAGFGNPRKLTAIFYLRDFAVLKVMFTAIVVCILGLFYFSLFGWINLGRVYLLPTFIWPQIVGGLVLGIGFVMGGYCPTTSVVATVSGKMDGLIFIVGMMIGAVFFADKQLMVGNRFDAQEFQVPGIVEILEPCPGSHLSFRQGNDLHPGTDQPLGVIVVEKLFQEIDQEFFPIPSGHLYRPR